LRPWARLVGARRPGYARRMVVPGRCAVPATLLACAVFGCVKPLVAEPASWLVLEGVCPVHAADVASRVDRQLIGARPANTRARVGIEATDAGYRVSVRAERAGKELGLKHLVAATCDEGVEAAVLVLAIALTEPERGLEPALTAPSEPPRELVFVEPAPPPSLEHDRAAAAADETAAARGRRLGMLVGVETGTVPGAAPYLGVSFALPVEAWELWSALRYGLPTEEAAVETASSEQTQRDFGALELSVCRGIGVAWRLSLCAGGEFGVVRMKHTRRDAEVETDTNEDRARVAAVGTTRLAGRAGMLRPELQFSAAAASLGPGAAPSLSLRLGAGVAVHF